MTVRPQVIGLAAPDGGGHLRTAEYTGPAGALPSLHDADHVGRQELAGAHHRLAVAGDAERDLEAEHGVEGFNVGGVDGVLVDPGAEGQHRGEDRGWLGRLAGHRVDAGKLLDPMRSEEHTSELQALMRTSYAVFRLKKNTNRLH